MSAHYSKKIAELPHNCGLVTLYYFNRNIPESDFIDAFSLLCEGWPYCGVKDTEIFKVMDYLTISKKFKYTNCTNKQVKIKNLLNGRKYLVLIEGHYLVIDNNEIINDYCSKNTQIVCYWERVGVHKKTSAKNCIIRFLNNLWNRIIPR